MKRLKNELLWQRGKKWSNQKFFKKKNLIRKKWKIKNSGGGRTLADVYKKNISIVDILKITLKNGTSRLRLSAHKKTRFCPVIYFSAYSMSLSQNKYVYDCKKGYDRIMIFPTNLTFD
jgi:hypothetical protein